MTTTDLPARTAADTARVPLLLAFDLETLEMYCVTRDMQDPDAEKFNLYSAVIGMPDSVGGQTYELRHRNTKGGMRHFSDGLLFADLGLDDDLLDTFVANVPHDTTQMPDMAGLTSREVFPIVIAMELLNLSIFSTTEFPGQKLLITSPLVPVIGRPSREIA
jgi:hypothetical protein